MEELGLLEEWLENEKKLRPLLEEMRPLLEKRIELEKKDPRLLLLRSSKAELLPRETSSSASNSSPSVDLRPTTLLLGSREPLEGLPPRPVPDFEKFQKMVEKRKVQNRKKHEKEKKKRAEAKGKKEEGGKMDTEDS
jgi:hypothetical protein